MKNRYKKVIYIFSSIVLFSIILGVVKLSLKYIDNNPNLYIPKKQSTTNNPHNKINKEYF